MAVITTVWEFWVCGAASEEEKWLQLIVASQKLNTELHLPAQYIHKYLQKFVLLGYVNL